MKCSLYVACLSFVIAACGPTPILAKDLPTSAEQLRNELQSALKAKDTNAVVSLFNWEGGSNDCGESEGMREIMIRLQTDAMLKTNIASVKLSPLPTGFQPVRTNEENGICEKFNVTVVGMIDVRSSTGSMGQLPYGKKGDAFYIAGVILEKLSGQPLYVRVLAGPNADLLTYTGSWVYVKDGKEIKVGISDKINRFKMCWGDYIKSCTIQRTSTNSLDRPGFAGWFYFEVSEGGKMFFNPRK